jgi:methionyl-tRNA formyltransferase
MRVGLVGSVDSSLLTLTKLFEYNFDIAGVWGYEPESTHNVSGYCSLREFSEEHGLIFHSFVKINNAQTKNELIEANLDLLFVVGLSQLVDKDIIDLPKYGCVGFHPTKLPRGRGRAPMAWLILKEKEGAATFFKIGDGTDNGEIYVQEPFTIDENDDATSVYLKLNRSINVALDKWFPLLIKEKPNGKSQDERSATYYARRAPLDGYLNWENSANMLDRIVKAAAKPHPGAYSFYEDNRVIIWRSCYHKEGFPIGVIGRVVDFVNNHPVIQTGNGYLEIEQYEMLDYKDNPVLKRLIVGSRLGYYDQYEIFKLRNEINELRSEINKINEKGINNCTSSR